MITSILEQSFLFFPLTLGIYISYGVLRIPDLTTDGSFLLGAALFAISIHSGLPPIFAVFLAAGGGAFCGIVAGLLQSRLKLNPLICGILLVFILNTLTLKLMGRPNLSLFAHPSLFGSYPNIMILGSLTLAFVLMGSFLLKSPFGLMLSAFGNNSLLLHLSGKNSDVYRICGLSLSNTLVATCGALTAQIHGYADIGMGTGVVLIALGTVIMGTYFYRKSSSLLKILSCLGGTVTYFSLINFLILVGLDPIYLRLVIGLCLIAFLGTMQKNRGGEYVIVK